jgi:hypothetical protein
MVHVGLGEHDPALKALEQGLRDRDFRVTYLGVDATWDPLRDNRRFIALLERVGLPQALPPIRRSAKQSRGGQSEGAGAPRFFTAGLSRWPDGPTRGEVGRSTPHAERW